MRVKHINFLTLIYIFIPAMVGLIYVQTIRAAALPEKIEQTIEPILPGDRIERISCGDNYQATALIVDSVRPDSLIIDQNGHLIYSDEGNGTIKRYANGTIEEIVSGLNNPEGIVQDEVGNIYVVEDLLNGRLLKISPEGSSTVLLTDLESPEGITLGQDGLLYLSTSAADKALVDPPDDQVDLDNNYFSQILQVDPNDPSNFKVILKTKPQYETTVIDPTNGEIEGAFFSYTGLITAENGNIYFTNELSGFDVITVTQVPNPIPILPPVNLTLHFTSTESIFVLDPSDLPVDPEIPPQPIVSDLIAPEGTGFSANNRFPLFVAEAKIPDGDPSRLWRITSDLQPELLCTGFDSLEDVVVGENETLIVSEENSGLIIALQKSTNPPIATEVPSQTVTPDPLATPSPTGDRLTFLPFISTP